jgi:hypothetical protein
LIQVGTVKWSSEIFTDFYVTTSRWMRYPSPALQAGVASDQLIATDWQRQLGKKVVTTGIT